MDTSSPSLHLDRDAEGEGPGGGREGGTRAEVRCNAGDDDDCTAGMSPISLLPLLTANLVAVAPIPSLPSH